MLEMVAVHVRAVFNFQSAVMLLSITFLGRRCSEIDEDSTSLRADGDCDCPDYVPDFLFMNIVLNLRVN